MALTINRQCFSGRSDPFFSPARIGAVQSKRSFPVLRVMLYTENIKSYPSILQAYIVSYYRLLEDVPLL